MLRSGLVHIALRGETRKPRNAGATLMRLSYYLGSYGFLLSLIGLMVIFHAWTQVTTPDLIGQVVDCYLVPAIASASLGNGASQSPKLGGAAANCWYADARLNRSLGEASSAMAGLIVCIVSLYVAGALSGGLQSYLVTWVGQHVLNQLRVDVFNHLHRLPLAYHVENRAGVLMSHITSDTNAVQQAINFGLVNVASGLLLLVWVMVAMLRKSVPYALLSMASVPFMVLATVWFSRQARQAFRVAHQEIGLVNANLHESIAGVREVQAFNREEASLSHFVRSNAAHRDANIRAAAFTGALSPILDALGYVAVAIVLVVGGLAVLRNETLLGTTISLGLMVTFVGYVQRFNHPIQQISVLWASIQGAVAGAERVLGILDTQPDLCDKPGALEMPRIQGAVEFVDVVATYVEDGYVLRGVSLKAEPGQMVAIVGPSGAGKTTIINLIPRFYDVVSGAVKIDGIDVRDVTRASLRKQIGIVLQDTFLFSDSVMNNIRYGCPVASDEQVMAAARLVHADRFIERLPQGYQTVLGERGRGLSHGQRQLIAIARTALTDPRILILDEATSSVDARTERLIQQALDRLLKGDGSAAAAPRTSFVVAHRLSTICHADQVLVLDGGQIVEHGTHASLLAARGLYYDLYVSQLGSA
ncbi:MAG: ABC transporter ATP-binding protein [Thermoflexales bacterium]|nr:ABC transporter ATP-binding protein [Thermoflexales bacterium]